MELEMKSKIIGLISILLVIGLTGCQKPIKIPTGKPAYDTPLGPGQDALRKITNPEEIPDFTTACMNTKDLKESADRSINYLRKPSSQSYFPLCGITHDHALKSLEEFSKMLGSGMMGKPLNDAIRQKFDVYMSVGCDDNGLVLFTGYYTPIFNGSETKTEQFKYPLYKMPSNLVKDANGAVLGRKTADGQTIDYPPRAVIEDAKLCQGQELVWLEDPFEVYIAHVQGSAKIRMSNNDLVTVGYAANNGKEYESIAQKMIDDGVISRDQLSLKAMIDYFKAHQDQVAKYTRMNPRFVFFKKEDGPPRGSLNEPVTTMRSIATDKTIFPRGSLTFISTNLPRSAGSDVTIMPYTGFALDQDTGGAIRAPGRCDVYMGIGDEAGKLAGQTYQEGKLYYLFLKQ